MLTAKEIAKLLAISESEAYRIIREYKSKRKILHKKARYKKSDFKEDWGFTDEEIDKELHS